MRSRQADLWDLFWDLVEQKQLNFTLLWTPSHATDAQIAKGEVQALPFVVNAFADAYAGEAALRAKLGDNVMLRVHEIDELTVKVQNRLVAINLAVAAIDRRPEPKRVVPPRSNRTTEEALTRALNDTSHGHVPYPVGKTMYACRLCCIKQPRTATIRWLSTSHCTKMPHNAEPGPASRTTLPIFHVSHLVQYKQRISLYIKCGFWGSKRVDKLRFPCGKPDEYGRRCIRRWKDGLFPVTGRSWPEAASSRDGARVTRKRPGATADELTGIKRRKLNGKQEPSAAYSEWDANV